MFENNNGFSREENPGDNDLNNRNGSYYSYKNSFVNDSNFAFGNNENQSSDLNSSTYYSENCKKHSRKKKYGLMHLIAVAVVSSIIGGTVAGAGMLFAEPYLMSLFGGLLPQSSLSAGTNPDNGIYKKIEIEKTDSPVSAIAEKVGPSIVGISVTAAPVNNFFSFGGLQGTSEGSGIIISQDGYIVTNYHVIQSALAERASGTVKVIFPNEKDKPYTAEIIGHDWRTDLAVIKVQATGLPAAELGNSDELKVGDLAVAIGNPAGLELMGSVTTGIISGLDRSIPLEDIKDLKLIQTDASINPGNSGGALVNSAGLVIGINNAKMGGSGYEGLGFAIPINTAKEITENLIEYKYVKGRPLLGITVDTRFTEEYARQYGFPTGVLVADVHPLSGAYKAGIKIGDVITKIDQVAIKNREELDENKNRFKPGETIKLEVFRDNTYKTFEVTMSEDTGNK